MVSAVRTALVLATTALTLGAGLPEPKAATEPSGTPLPPFGQFESARARDNARCGTCHEAIYANWLAGPHARAWRQLEIFRATIEAHPERATIEPYVAHVGKEFEGRCTWCHATQNLYETYYQGVEEQGPGGGATPPQWEDYFKLALGFEHGFPRGREDTASLETGVDCLTCHKRGDKVVTRAGYVRDPAAPRAPGQCDPVASPLFSSAYGCRACHVDNVVTQQQVLERAGSLDAAPGRPGTPDSPEQGPAQHPTDCLSCHEETDDAGRGTHYFYWAHDIPSGRRDRLVGGIFETLDVQVVDAEGGGRELAVRWRNEAHNHLTSLCQEYVVRFTVEGLDGAPVDTFETRLNRKEEFDEIELYEVFGAATPGRAGHAFDPSGAAGIAERHALPAGTPDGGVIVVEARHKHQYWLPDDLSTLIYQQRIPWGSAIGTVEPVAIVPPFDPADPAGTWEAMHAARDARRAARTEPVATATTQAAPASPALPAAVPSAAAASQSGGDPVAASPAPDGPEGAGPPPPVAGCSCRAGGTPPLGLRGSLPLLLAGLALAWRGRPPRSSTGR